jgi:hypothetical protein
LLHNGWLASNAITFWVTFMVFVSAARSRDEPSSSHLYLQQLSWVTIIIPLPPRFHQDITELFSDTLQGTGSLNFHTEETLYLYVCLKLLCFISLVMIFCLKECGLSFDLIINIILSDGSFYQLKLPLE